MECDVNWRVKEDVHESVSAMLFMRGDGGLPRNAVEARRMVGILDLGLKPGGSGVVEGNDLPTPPLLVAGPGSRVTPPKAALSGRPPPTSDVWKVNCDEFLDGRYAGWNSEPFAVRRSHLNFKR